MKKLFFVVTLLLLCGCSEWSKITSSNEPTMPVSGLTTDFTHKDFHIKGRVRGEYTKTCILFNLICSSDIFIFDDLMNKATKMGAQEVINVVIDRQNSSWLWFFLYSHQNYRANGLAITFVPPKDAKN